MSRVLYVAPAGSDRWSGALPEPSPRGDDGPFATLGRAVSASRESVAERRIVVRGGWYFDTSVEMGVADSGLCIEAMPGERPVLAGGRRITGWHDEPDSPFWSAPVPEVRDGSWDFRLLVVNGRCGDRSRLPESGAFEHETVFDVRWLSTMQGGWERAPTERELSTFTWRKGDLGDWFDTLNAEITIFHKWDESLCGVASRDTEHRIVKLAGPCGHPPGAFGNHRYVVWNLREGMSRPGQWYLDRRAGKVVYWPLPDEDMGRADVMAPRVESVISFHGDVRDVYLTDLTIVLANAPKRAEGFGAIDAPAAIQASDGLRGCRFTRLTVQNTAGGGMRIDGPCSALRIVECAVTSTGGGGIHVSPKAVNGADSPGADCLIERNRVSRVGLIHTSAIAIACRGCTVRHNEISDTPYTGICCGGGSPLVENNVVRRVMQDLNDGAAIYLTSCTAAHVRENVVSDIPQSGANDSIRNGIYLDEQCRGVLVERNVVMNCVHAQFNHLASDNVVQGNVFVSDDQLKLSFIRCSGYRLEDNVLFARGKLVVAGRDGAIAAHHGNIFHSQSGDYEEHLIGEDYLEYEVRPLGMAGSR